LAKVGWVFGFGSSGRPGAIHRDALFILDMQIAKFSHRRKFASLGAFLGLQLLHRPFIKTRGEHAKNEVKSPRNAVFSVGVRAPVKASGTSGRLGDKTAER
jgi:hypothetical protein